MLTAMEVEMFNAIKYTEELVAVDFSTDQAHKILSILVDTMNSNFVTRQDLQENFYNSNIDRRELQDMQRAETNKMETDIRIDMKNMETGIRSDMKEMEAGIRTDMKEMDAGIRSDMKNMEAGIRSDMKEMEIGIRADMQKMDERLSSRIDKVEIRLENIEKIVGSLENKLTIKLGGIMVIGITIIATLGKV
jgi:hypothetical protein